MADDQVSGPSAADGEASGGRVGAWTDTERYGLLLRIVKNALPEGKGPDWKTLSMPGRTTKALQHQWGQISAQLRDLDLTAGDDAAVVPKARATPRSKKTAKKAAAAGENDGEAEGETDEAAETPNKTPRKRAAATKADGTPKKRRTPAKKTPVKVESEDENEDMVNAEEKADEQ